MPTRSTATARARINWGGTEPGRGSREGKNEAKKEGKKLNLDLFEEKKASLSSPLSVFYTLYTPSLLLRAKTQRKTLPVFSLNTLRAKKPITQERKRRRKKTLRFHSQ
jgi:hypothetical protein